MIGAITLTPSAKADLGDVRARLDEALVTLVGAGLPGGRDVARVVGEAITSVYEVLAAPNDGQWVQQTFARALVATRGALARLQEDPAEPSAEHERARDLVAGALQILNKLPALRAEGFEAPRQQHCTTTTATLHDVPLGCTHTVPSEHTRGAWDGRCGGA